MSTGVMLMVIYLLDLQAVKVYNNLLPEKFSQCHTLSQTTRVGSQLTDTTVYGAQQKKNTRNITAIVRASFNGLISLPLSSATTTDLQQRINRVFVITQLHVYDHYIFSRLSLKF